MNLHALLSVQQLDTHINQLEHRRAGLAERKALDEHEKLLASVRLELAKQTEAISELEAGVSTAEEKGVECDTKRKKLEAQLRTVIAPREAESLQREIDALRQERDEADSLGLDLMEQLSEQDTRRDALAAQLDSLLARRPELQTALETRDAEILAEITSEKAAREEAAAAVGNDLGAYEQRRKKLGGIAVAALEGRTCSGCHLDLSAGELQELKSVPPGDDAECPNCGRWLVL